MSAPSAVEARSIPALSSHRWYALAIMILIYSCHFLDRAVLSIVAEPVRKEFGLSDSQLGVLNGIAFALMFAFVRLLGVPAPAARQGVLLAAVPAGFFGTVSSALIALSACSDRVDLCGKSVKPGQRREFCSAGSR